MKKDKENIFKKIKNSYNKLSKKSKTILWVWIVLLLVITILIIVCNSNNKVTSSHSKLEEAMVVAAKQYAEDNDVHGTKEQELRIDLDELINSKYLNKKDVNDNTCIGYVSLYSTFDKKGIEKVTAKSYINCKKYTTEGYKSE